MPALSKQEVIDQTKLMLGWRDAEMPRLDRLHLYLKGRQSFLWLPRSAPDEVRRLARMSRVNVLQLAVNSATQSLYIDGYRSPKAEDEDPAWRVWQQNRLDARQIGVHRAATCYGVAYVSVITGEPVPVVRGLSPRNLTAVYGEDDDWPVWALEKRRSAVKGRTLYRLFDGTHAYYVSVDGGGQVEYVDEKVHDAGHVPIVRFLSTCDLDDEVYSSLENLMTLQDQIDLTTFGLLVVQHYGSFPQKWIAGWMAETEDDKIAVAANKVLTFEDSETKLGSFQAASLDGYINSRRDAMKNLAAIAQMPESALRGELVNLSAEALEAAKDGERRKNTEAQKMFGESWEQTLELAGVTASYQVDPQAEVRWKDMEMRSFSATIDALGKMAAMLGIPQEAIWERVPGATQQEIARWRVLAAQGDALGRLENYLERSANALADEMPPTI